MEFEDDLDPQLHSKSINQNLTNSSHSDPTPKMSNHHSSRSLDNSDSNKKTHPKFPTTEEEGKMIYNKKIKPSDFIEYASCERQKNEKTYNKPIVNMKTVQNFRIPNHFHYHDDTQQVYSQTVNEYISKKSVNQKEVGYMSSDISSQSQQSKFAKGIHEASTIQYNNQKQKCMDTYSLSLSNVSEFPLSFKKYTNMYTDIFQIIENGVLIFDTKLNCVNNNINKFLQSNKSSSLDNFLNVD